MSLLVKAGFGELILVLLLPSKDQPHIHEGSNKTEGLNNSEGTLPLFLIALLQESFIFPPCCGMGGGSVS